MDSKSDKPMLIDSAAAIALLSPVADLLSIGMVPTAIARWVIARKDEGKTTTIDDYIEFLRRNNHQELVNRITASTKEQENTRRILAQIEAAVNSIQGGLNDDVTQSLLDFRNHEIDAGDASFEASYLKHMANRYGRIKTLGVREMKEFKQDLSVAYVSLNLGTNVNGGQPDAKFNATQMMASYPLMTIQGSAGSGKTTLLHWIILECTKPRSATNHWNGWIPFFLPLRALPSDSKGVPRVKHLVECSVDTGTFASPVPKGWVERVLNAKRAILLIDGVDEIAPAHRPKLWEWLSEFSSEHEGNRFYVTSRFLADGEEKKNKQLWNPPKGFVQSSVQDMSDSDISVFIEKWHSAIASSELDLTEKKLIEDAGAKLPIRIFDPANRRVRDLCKTPLLCALVCALHWKEEGYLPARRIDLYDRCCKMLIEERDRKRDIAPPDGPLGKFTLADKEMLLQRLAWSMMANASVKQNDSQRMEITRDQAVRWIRAHIPSCEAVECRTCEAAVVLDHLVERTALLREPSKGKIDFPHRTFQEYMAACAAGHLDNAVELAKRSANDQWHETIILAAGTPVGGSAFGNRLIEELLERGKRLKRQRPKNLSLALALACLETGKQIQPKLREQVLRQLTKLVPPRSEMSARHLAAAGDALLPHLEYSKLRHQGWRTVVYSAHAVGLVGSHKAIQMLEDPQGYAGDDRDSVVRAICTHEIVNPLKLKGVVKHLEEGSFVQLGPWSRNITSLAPIAENKKIRRLWLPSAGKVRDWGLLGTLTNLEYLNLLKSAIDADGLRSLENLEKLKYVGLRGTPIDDGKLVLIASNKAIEALDLSRTPITSAGVRELFKSGLKLLELDLSSTLVEDDFLSNPNAETLRLLVVSNTKFDPSTLRAIDASSLLSSLMLDGTPLNDSHLETLKKIPNLKMLSIAQTNVTEDGVVECIGWRGLEMLEMGLEMLTPRVMTSIENSEGVFRCICRMGRDSAVAVPPGVQRLHDQKKMYVVNSSLPMRSRIFAASHDRSHMDIEMFLLYR